MKTKIPYLIAAFFVAAFSLTAQQDYLGQISTGNIDISKKEGITTISMDIDLGNLRIDGNHLLVITPTVTSPDSAMSVELPPVWVLGGRRNAILKRPYTWKGKIEPGPDAVATVVRKNETGQSVHYTTTLPFGEWQRQAALSLQTDVWGCADCLLASGREDIMDSILPGKFVPDFRMPYIVPEVEPVKQRSEHFSAHLNYVAGQHKLLPDFKDNAAELKRVDESISLLRSDKDLTITDFIVSGYASPEGSYAMNLELSKRRAETFAAYLENIYGYRRGQFKVEWFGEDWKGLREAVEASALAKKQEILDIIDKTAGEDARDARLIAIDNGQTYATLLSMYYPPLRRNDYNIGFVARAFNVDEAKEALKSYPKKLSLNEMFLVAETYPANSAEFKEVFAIAADTFPDSEVANLNVAISELHGNNPDAALKRLRKVKDNARATGLAGIAHALKGGYEEALRLMQEAADEGDADAAHNLGQLRMLLDDMR